MGTVRVTGLNLAFQVCDSSVLNSQLLKPRNQTARMGTWKLPDALRNRLPEMTERQLVLFAEVGLGAWSAD